MSLNCITKNGNFFVMCNLSQLKKNWFKKKKAKPNSCPGSLIVTFELLGSQVNLMLKKSESLTGQSNVHMQTKCQGGSNSDLT